MAVPGAGGSGYERIPWEAKFTDLDPTSIQRESGCKRSAKIFFGLGLFFGGAEAIRKVFYQRSGFSKILGGSFICFLVSYYFKRQTDFPEDPTWLRKQGKKCEVMCRDGRPNCNELISRYETLRDLNMLGEIPELIPLFSEAFFKYAESHYENGHEVFKSDSSHSEGIGLFDTGFQVSLHFFKHDLSKDFSYEELKDRNKEFLERNNFEGLSDGEKQSVQKKFIDFACIYQIGAAFSRRELISAREFAIKFETTMQALDLTLVNLKPLCERDVRLVARLKISPEVWGERNEGIYGDVGEFRSVFLDEVSQELARNAEVGMEPYELLVKHGFASEDEIHEVFQRKREEFQRERDVFITKLLEEHKSDDNFEELYPVEMGRFGLTNKGVESFFIERDLRRVEAEEMTFFQFFVEYMHDMTKFNDDEKRIIRAQLIKALLKEEKLSNATSELGYGRFLSMLNISIIEDLKPLWIEDLKQFILGNMNSLDFFERNSPLFSEEGFKKVFLETLLETRPEFITNYAETMERYSVIVGASRCLTNDDFFFIAAEYEIQLARENGYEEFIRRNGPGLFEKLNVDQKREIEKIRLGMFVNV